MSDSVHEENMDVDDELAHFIPSFSLEEIKAEQASDPAIASMLRLKVKYFFAPPSEEIKSELTEVRAMCHIWGELFTDNGILYRNSKQGKVMVLPRSLRKMVMEELHSGYTRVARGITTM